MDDPHNSPQVPGTDLQRPSAEAASSAPLPRIYCVTDPDARVAAVLERRPRKWWRVGRWDLATGRYDGGAWFRGTLYPQCCDLSPGGRWLSYFALKTDSAWPAGATYNAVSRLPWLKALAAWRESGTWSRGHHFVADTSVWEIGPPTVGDAAVCGTLCGMGLTAPAQFATERRRGWREAAATQEREPDDVWDERREVVMEKVAPTSRHVVLSVRGKFEAFRTSPDLWSPHPAPYALTRSGRVKTLAGVQWADWTCEGHLATATGRALRILDTQRGRVVSESRLTDEEPRPGPAPAWANEW
ncbi:hypothetical protein J8F10_17240 [Gemmata sp. G18]|uniref:Uncharacterized protein n=1 Tax=Gemmata palustris TaxID=2822762 RepID=A0ABS5BTH6_9BACT|nr:hypothetical protein [Gemmata palustris]MBP3957017.1 hypothetical protein [Gemmata palustris]